MSLTSHFLDHHDRAASPAAMDSLGVPLDHRLGAAAAISWTASASRRVLRDRVVMAQEARRA